MSPLLSALRSQPAEKDPVAGRGQNADPQFRVVPQHDEGLRQLLGRIVDGVDLGPVQSDLEHPPRRSIFTSSLIVATPFNHPAASGPARFVMAP